MRKQTDSTEFKRDAILKLSPFVNEPLHDTTDMFWRVEFLLKVSFRFSQYLVIRILKIFFSIAPIHVKLFQTFLLYLNRMSASPTQDCI